MLLVACSKSSFGVPINVHVSLQKRNLAKILKILENVKRFQKMSKSHRNSYLDCVVTLKAQDFKYVYNVYNLFVNNALYNCCINKLLLLYLFIVQYPMYIIRVKWTN